MNIQGFYKEIASDYEGSLQRLGSGERIMKYLKIFQKDENYAILKKSMKEKDYPTAFRAIHTIKGIAGNLGFDALYTNACVLTELLRVEIVDIQAVQIAYEQVCKSYESVLQAMQHLNE